MKLTQWKIPLWSVLLFPTFALSAELSLQKYLSEVQNNNDGIKAGQLIIEGTQDRSNEGKLIFRPSLFAQAQSTIDKKPVVNTASQGDRTDNSFVTVGLAQQFDFGLKSQLSYSLIHTQIYNASSTFVSKPEYNDGVAKLELSQSLWRNFWGQEQKSQETLINSQAKASSHVESYKIKQTLAQAESIYWSLSQLRKVVKVQTNNLVRAKKIADWNRRRTNTGLAERSDYLQADANLKLREYELQNTQLELTTLERTFNTLRGNTENQVSENLDIFDGQSLSTLNLPGKSELRDDTKAALEYQNIAIANANLAQERNKPTLEVYGSYAMNGRDVERSEAIDNSFKTNKSTTAIGVRFNTPLDFGNTSKNIDGYKKEKVAAEYTFKKKVYDQDREWNDLVKKFEDAKLKLALVEKIAEANKTKSLNESDRLTKGRTTTFQVLNFEQDYAQSELQKIQSETNLLNIYAQLKTFSNGGSK